MRQGRDAILALAVVLLTTAAVMGRQTPAVVIAEADVPGAVRDALDARWAGWTFAPVEPAAASVCAEVSPRPSSILRIDLDGDGRADYAATVRTPDGVRLAVLVNRPWGYDVYDADRLGDSTSPGVLTARPRGNAYRNPRTLLPDFFGNDTIVFTSCGTPPVAYLWTGFGFRREVLGS